MIAHLERAAASADVRSAVDALLDAWRDSPVPAVAELIEKLQPESLLAGVRDGNAAAAAGAVAPLARVEKDPRLAGAVCAILEDPPWHATGSKPFWTRLWAIAAANRDPRSIERLAKIRYAKIIHGKSMQGWMMDKLTAERAALKKQFPSGAPSLPKGAAAILARVKPKPKPSANAAPRVRDDEALFAAVYANPDDDAPRAVLADYLAERGDPRGEFIQLQLKDDPATRPRQLAILRKHQRAWLGEFSTIVGYVAYPNVTPDDQRSIYMWWRRGFVAGAIVKITKPKLLKLAGAPFWSTIERVSHLHGNPRDPEWNAALLRLLGSLRGLRELDGTDLFVIHALGRSPAAKRIRGVSLHVGSDIQTLADALAVFPSLDLLDVSFADGVDLTPLKPVIARLKWLKIGDEHELERKNGKLVAKAPLDDAARALLAPVL